MVLPQSGQAGRAAGRSGGSDQGAGAMAEGPRLPQADAGPENRSAALQALAEKWPDQTTRDLLAQRAVQGSNAEARGAACSALGKMHSEFGRILPTRDLDGIGPYVDPLEPIPRKHIEQAAAKAGIRPDDVDAQLASLSAYLGWDVMNGAKTKAVKENGRPKPGRKRRNWWAPFDRRKG